jgi:hypothetical protein
MIPNMHAMDVRGIPELDLPETTCPLFALGIRQVHGRHNIKMP